MLWVADAGQGALLSFDPFGATGPVVEAPDAIGRLVSVAPTAAFGAQLVVAGSQGVALVRDGSMQVVPAAPFVEPLRAAVRARGGFMVLTPTRVVRLGDVERD